MSTEKLLFQAKTVQGLVLKTLSESIKDIITDGNLVISKEGISLKAMDTSSTALVNFKLNATQFEEFECERKLIAGVNLASLHRMVRPVTNQDALTLFIEEKNPNVMGIRREDEARQAIITSWLKLLDLNEDEIAIPPADFDSLTVMISADFQKHIRDLHAIGEVLEIRSVKNQLILMTQGDIGKLEAVIEANSNSMTQENVDDDKIVQGLFSLKYLSLFCKATGLSPQLKLCLKADFPIVLMYNVANLGSLTLMLAPHHGSKANNQS